MNILGIDPGNRSGWCLYDAAERRALGSGQFDFAEFYPGDVALYDLVVIERPQGYGFNTRPEMVECGICFGVLQERFDSARCNVEHLTRRDVKNILTEATLRDIVVTKDASAWAALKLLHGGEACAKEGGALYGVKAHERAALAVAVAFALKQATVTTKAGGSRHE